MKDPAVSNSTQPVSGEIMSLVLIIDGNSLVYRAHYALIRSPLSNAKGFPTSAIHGFGGMLTSLLDKHNPDKIAVAFDAGKINFRHELYKDYKAGRSATPEDLIAQFPIVKRLIKALGIGTIELPGYEADDILGTLAVKLAEEGDEVLIVSGDRDMFQIARPGICILYPSKKSGQFDLYDAEKIKEKYGVPPESFPDMKGLAGDKSDAIPGVPGVGEKTAVGLLQKYHTIDSIYEHLDELPKSKRKDALAAHKDDAFLSRKLGTICLEAPIKPEDIPLAEQKRNEDELAALISEYDLRALAKKLDITTGIPGQTPQLSFSGDENVSKSNEGIAVKSNNSPGEYRAVITEEDLQEVLNALEKSDHFAIDTETTSTSPMEAELVGISLSWKSGNGVYIPVGHRSLFGQQQLDRGMVLDKLRPFLESPQKFKHGHNIKYDMLVLRNAGLIMNGIDTDTMVASYLLNPEGMIRHNMNDTALRHLDYRCIPFSELVPKGSTFADVDIQRATRYAAEDADITMRLSETLTPMLKSSDLYDLFQSLEMPLVPVLADMEYHGISVDTEALEKTGHDLARKALSLEELIYAEAGVKFNVNSPKQLGEILFEKMGIKPLKKTKSGPSTNHQVLTDLSPEHKIAGYVLDYRTLTKLKNTYVDSLIRLKNPKTGRVHTSFNQTVTATGRLSSSEPNMQNIPSRQDVGRLIRRAFISEDNYSLLSADYSQIELRLMAHYSKDSTLTKAFQEGTDVHAQTAAGIFDVPLDEVSRELRNTAKTINFGVIYGMNAFKLSNELGIDISEAAGYIKRFFERLPGVQEFRENTVTEARECGYVKTIMGRRRSFPDINSRNGNIRQSAERAAVNTVIQGSAADMIKIAMIRIHKYLKEKNLKTRLLLQVHDELVFEMPSEENDISNDLTNMMENAIPCSVKITANLKRGTNLADME